MCAQFIKLQISQFIGVRPLLHTYSWLFISDAQQIGPQGRLVQYVDKYFCRFVYIQGVQFYWIPPKFSKYKMQCKLAQNFSKG